jgi:hypothetical protein
MKSKFYVLTILLSAFISTVFGQGCVAVRAMGGNNPMSTSGYTLNKGEWQVGIGYRYFHSWRHFVGTEEQKQRQTSGGGHTASGKELGNAVNIYSHALDFNISYGLTDRLQLNASIPWVHNERSQVLHQTAPIDTFFRYSVYAKGLGDVRLSASYWIVDPIKAHNGNLSLGLGVKLPTGSFEETDVAPQANGTKKRVVMDQAIQPGDGGLGVSIEVQGFRKIYKGIYGFVNGYYLFNPRETNGSHKSNPTIVRHPYDKGDDGKLIPLDTLNGYNLYASPDQYFGRAGVMGSILKSKLTLSLAGRIEGIPAFDALGGQVAYRRPGYVIAIEYGAVYRVGNHSLSLIVPFNLVRDRIQSAADLKTQRIQNAALSEDQKKVHVQGDAAFADYSININYSYRIGKLF